jgi:hypothetical protein
VSELDPTALPFGLMSVLAAQVVLAYAVPRELSRRSMERHYDEWIVKSRAYWWRASDKWVIRSRIFYVDEFIGDLLGSIGWAVTGSLISALAFSTLLSREVSTSLFGPNLLVNAILLIAMTQCDRVRLIDAAIAIRTAIEPRFEPAGEMEKVTSGEDKWVKKVVGVAPTKAKE